MSNLIVTFGRRDSNLEVAANARTTSVVIDGTKRRSTLIAGGQDNVLTLYPEADCWVAVDKADGETPNAESSTKRRFLVAEVQRRFSCKEGDLVSVVQKA